jgi:HPr kinase/phosphorylase
MDKQIKTNLHGVAMSVFGYGVLITGCSGVGKSDLGLELVDRGHKLIADDFIVIDNASHHNIMLAAEGCAKHFLHLRGLGFINIDAMYSNFTSTMFSSKLDLIIELSTDDNLLNKDITQPLMLKEDILDIKVNKFILPLGTRRNLALIVEIYVKYYKQLQNGYDAHHDFLEYAASIK